MKKNDIEKICSDNLFELECFLTSLVFVILKLSYTISWAWFWVLFPIWILLIIKIFTYRNNKNA